MPARAHRRAPDPLAGAVRPPTPHAGGSLQWPPGGGLALYAPLPKPPGRWPPSTPDPPAVRRTGESVKSPYLPPRRGSSPTPLQSPGSLSPGKVPPPRACTPRLAPRARPPASRAGFASTSPPPPHPPVRPAPPAAPAGAPRPPFPGPRSPAGRPSPRGWGRGDRRWRTVTWGPACRGSYREGHPARAPTVTSPAIPAPPTQRDAATLAGPHSLSPGPLGPGRFYTDSPTPFGV
ncbi:hypothetical protein N7534_012129 [Penicillium rubens]|nr:hypothetical protein N7534_012129 [Penicillium rubens]